MSSDMQNPEDKLDNERYEPRDVVIGSLVKWLALLFLLVVIGAVVSIFLFKSWVATSPTSNTSYAFETDQTPPPEPVIQANPAQDLILFRKAEDQKLNTYGWVDRSAGIVHIPVSLALKLTAQKGLPLSKPMAKAIPAQKGAGK
jgi:hypothetical protein